MDRCRCGDRLRLAHHAKDVPAGKLGEILVAPAPPDQLGEEQRIAADAVHPGRRFLVRNPVEVAADPDMIVAGHLHDMLDVIGDLADGRGRLGIGLLPRVERGFSLLRPADQKRFQPRLFSALIRIPLARGVRNVAAVEIDHHHPAVCRKELEYIVGDIPRMIGDGHRTAVREDDRSLRHRDRVFHRLGADMGEVDQHAHAVHLADDCLAERRQAIPLGIVGRAVGDVAIGEVRERHVARAEPVELAERRQRTADLVPALDADQRGDFSFAMDADDVVGGVGHLEIVRISVHHAIDDVDFLQSLADRLVAMNARIDEHRPELRADVALMKPRHVGHQRDLPLVGAAGEPLDASLVIVRELARQVVMPVDQRRRLEDSVDPRLHLGIDGLRAKRTR